MLSKRRLQLQAQHQAVASCLLRLEVGPARLPGLGSLRARARGSTATTVAASPAANLALRLGDQAAALAASVAQRQLTGQQRVASAAAQAQRPPQLLLFLLLLVQRSARRRPSQPLLRLTATTTTTRAASARVKPVARRALLQAALQRAREQARTRKLRSGLTPS